jgi:hypothetical protein
MPPKADKWGKGHKADFLEKVRQRKINVNTDDPRYIEQIREKYWPDHKPATPQQLESHRCRIPDRSSHKQQER